MNIFQPVAAACKGGEGSRESLSCKAKPVTITCATSQRVELTEAQRNFHGCPLPRARPNACALLQRRKRSLNTRVAVEGRRPSVFTRFLTQRLLSAENESCCEGHRVGNGLRRRKRPDRLFRAPFLRRILRHS